MPANPFVPTCALDWVKFYAARADALGVWSALLEHLGHWRCIRVGTVCSGSDLCMKVLGALGEHVRASGVELKILHVFACEHDTRTQEWLTKHGDQQYLLSDIRDFATGWCHEVIDTNLTTLASGNATVELVSYSHNLSRLPPRSFRR